MRLWPASHCPLSGSGHGGNAEHDDTLSRGQPAVEQDSLNDLGALLIELLAALRRLHVAELDSDIP